MSESRLENIEGKPDVSASGGTTSSRLVEHKVPSWMAFGINLLIFFMETAYLLWIRREHGEMENFLLFHGGVVLLLVCWLSWCKRVYNAYLFPTFTLVFVTALGPMGALGTAYATLVRAYFLRGKHPMEALFQVLFPDEAGNRSEQLYQQLSRMDPNVQIDEGIAPLMDVIHHGHSQQKQAAILLMSRNYIPPFTPVLKAALKDRDPDVRTIAATAIARIESQIQEEGRELEQDLSYYQDEESLLSLAIHYDQHAWSGLLDPAQTILCREKAMAYYHKYLERQPRDVSVIKEVGRLLYRGGDLDAAGHWFDEHRDLGRNSPSFITWDLEVLYTQGRYEEIRSIVQHSAGILKDVSYFPMHIADAIRLWSGENPLAAGGEA